MIVGKERKKWMQAGRVASGRIDFKGTNFEGVGGERRTNKGNALQKKNLVCVQVVTIRKLDSNCQ